ncbi:uncharacterized protein METZ01_LOCUS353591, partial [marine metagenome]
MFEDVASNQDTTCMWTANLQLAEFAAASPWPSNVCYPLIYEEVRRAYP